MMQGDGMTEEKEEGIKAIIFLQEMAGITESKERAERGWNSLPQGSKDYTLSLYRRFKDKAKKEVRTDDTA